MKTCSVCGGQLRANNRSGICGRNPECRRAQNNANQRANYQPRSARTCAKCGGPMRADSKYDVCRRNPECRKAKHTAYYEQNKTAILDRQAQWYKDNAARLLEKQAAYRKNNPAKIRDLRRRQYGLEPGDYEAMLVAQEGRCRGCGRDDVPLYIDHDHSCCPKLPTCGKCNRGLLCEKCNRGIGFLQDDPSTLRALAAYLEAWAELKESDMPEGPMNVELNPVTEVVETQDVPEGTAAGTPDVVQVPAGQTAHFPTHAPRLTSGGAAVLKALTGR